MTNDIKEIQTIQPGLSEIKEIKGELANVKKRKRRSKKINKLTDGQIRINHVSSEKKRRELERAIFDELVAVVPDLQPQESRSELIIYLKSLSYLSWLYERNEKLRKQIIAKHETKTGSSSSSDPVQEQNGNIRDLVPKELIWELGDGQSGQ
ncbi:BBT_HP_G0091730.mRNA.1.CDS.1 [Saccharomyces cerevisiae]|nr:BBT_HP_G0045020.mRNA.1.CDS.1 [Saccharomyces cerevisiae]CAI4969451.1 BBT_HP_G0057680.mRNA.1.CDS.1 [Saccharomyces cerevisiae]CAI5007437.1 BBT_HP_G0086800.mRNA.1.CDS.1 [Saccharomyces cerevisiae]CAI5013453.1 BBT_HP_G0091730.mRNA.1.CDS.1 [Saccharomyces cerevisiae]CAI6614784.1 BBT_HP_G0045020.mRNA.1.CDS.1 [Saccharomyces cerevisiae]